MKYLLFVLLIAAGVVLGGLIFAALQRRMQRTAEENLAAEKGQRLGPVGFGQQEANVIA